MQILLLRHGKTKGNLERRYIGRTDEPLLIEEIMRLQKSPYRMFVPDVVYTSGMLRCRQTVEALFGPYKVGEFPNIAKTEAESMLLEENTFSLQMAVGRKKYVVIDGKRDSAIAYVGENSDLSECGSSCGEIPMVIHPGLNETDFGSFEYKNYEELNGNPIYQAWLDSGGMLAFPGGESGTEFRKRCRMAFLECIADAKKRNAGRVAFVVHGGTIMAIMEAFAVPKRDFYEWQVKNGDGFFVKLEKTAEKSFSLKLIESGL